MPTLRQLKPSPTSVERAAAHVQDKIKGVEGRDSFRFEPKQCLIRNVCIEVSTCILILINFGSGFIN